LDDNLGGKVNTFANDNKIGGIVDRKEGYLGLQRDLDQLGQWADEWQMEFNVDKCKVMHFGRSNQGRTYSVNGRALGRVIEQRDLGVQVHSAVHEYTLHIVWHYLLAGSCTVLLWLRGLPLFKGRSLSPIAFWLLNTFE